jgi:CelD/BcsL family acetyltransferase involved in cellulose biosynthesis
MLHVHRVERLEEIACLAPAWDALLAPDDPRAVFLTHAWFDNWFAAYADGRSPYVLVAAAGGVVRGVLPLLASRTRLGGLPLRRLELWSNGHSPCADLVAAPGFEADVATAFANHLLETDLAWDIATCAEVGAGARLEAVHATFPAHLRAAQAQRSAPFIPLDGDWETYRAALSKNFQRTLRNNRNRITRIGDAAIELLEEPDAIAAALDDVFAIGDKSWQGESGSAVGSNAANRAFYAGLVPALAPRRCLRLWFLRLAGRRVAFELHVVSNGVEFGLKTGYDREFESAGAGTFLDQSIVERLFAEPGLREYDLLGDADFYKQRWTPHARPYRRLTFFGTRTQGRLASMWTLRLKPVLRQARDLGRRAVTEAS